MLVALRDLQGNVQDISLVLTLVLHDQCGDMYSTVAVKKKRKACSVKAVLQFSCFGSGLPGHSRRRQRHSVFANLLHVGVHICLSHDGKVSCAYVRTSCNPSEFYSVVSRDCLDC